MKSLAFFFIILTLAASNNAQDLLNVMSFNIRCASCEKPDDVNHWSKRKLLVADVLKKYDPDIAGFQEAEYFAMNDIVELLPQYKWIGAGRDDGAKRGEANAVMYKPEKFELESQKTFWLSETPGIVSKGWDAAYNRTITIVLLKDKTTGKSFYFLNTHFDHLGEKARVESSKLILSIIDSLNDNKPVILCGDFNFTPDSEGYKIISEKLLDSHNTNDSLHTAGFTFNGFGKLTGPGNRIDFIFTEENSGVLSYKIITDTYNELYPSDHYPVAVQIKLK